MDQRLRHGCFRYGNRSNKTFQPWVGVVVLACLIGNLLFAQAVFGSQPELPPRVKEYRSKNFLMYSDLDEAEARTRLRRLDGLVSKVSEYWGHRLRGTIKCYLVEDISRWDEHKFETANARFVLAKLRGGTDVKSISSRAAQAIIYASAEDGVAEHEAVHAYCFQTFGRGGPEWYREGMAQVFSQQALPQGRELPEWAETLGCINNTDLTAFEMFRAADVSDTIYRQVRSTAPSPESLNDLTQVRERYARAWALCHFLKHHPIYRKRFRAVGRQVLTGGRVSFAQAFAGCQSEMDFELAQFTEHYATGYCVDRCQWRWKQRFRKLDCGEACTVRINAGIGFQPSGVQVLAGQTYKIQCSGEWLLSNDRPPCDANGNDQGKGRLLAVVMKDFQLSSSVALGTDVSYAPVNSGKIYLRCDDAWNQLSDNRGTISIRIERTR